VLYYVQNDVLFNSGHLSPLRYFAFDVIDRTMLQTNSSGTDFTDASLRDYYRQINMPRITIDYGNKLLQKRKNLLIFCSLIEEANQVARGIPGSMVITGETDVKKREKILSQFKAGVIRCVINVGVLTTGFDYPELEAVLIARSTMSLALYYQIVGRVMRPHKNKDCGWVVDLGGNIKFFGKIETMQIKTDAKGLYSIWNNGRQLTNVAFTKN
jgi:DNA repair protein RadD